MQKEEEYTNFAVKAIVRVFEPMSNEEIKKYTFDETMLLSCASAAAVSQAKEIPAALIANMKNINSNLADRLLTLDYVYAIEDTMLDRPMVYSSDWKTGLHLFANEDLAKQEETKLKESGFLCHTVRVNNVAQYIKKALLEWGYESVTFTDNEERTAVLTPLSFLGLGKSIIKKSKNAKLVQAMTAFVQASATDSAADWKEAEDYIDAIYNALKEASLYIPVCAEKWDLYYPLTKYNEDDHEYKMLPVYTSVLEAALDYSAMESKGINLMKSPVKDILDYAPFEYWIIDKSKFGYVLNSETIRKRLKE